MPDARAIVEGLRFIANDAIGLAVAWHVAVLAVVTALWKGWRPSRRAAGLLLTVPVASAAAVAFAYGNPFNGGVLGTLAIALLVIALRFEARAVAGGNAVARAAGLLMIAFGLFYPHFLETRPTALYLLAAPVGLVPCPTLSLVIGFTLVAAGLDSRAWSLILAAAGLFYGLFGAFRLGVRLDLGLVAGASALLAMVLNPRYRTHRLAAAH